MKYEVLKKNVRRVILPFLCTVSRSLSLSESALTFDDAIRILRRDTVGELSLELVSGALLSILVKPKRIKYI
jgi:hypothetical protein